MLCALVLTFLNLHEAAIFLCEPVNTFRVSSVSLQDTPQERKTTRAAHKTYHNSLPMAPAAAQDSWQWPIIAGDSLQSPMMDFIEQTVEIFRFEGTPPRDVVTSQAVASRDLLDQSTAPIKPERDYATMHDNFLESLLQEQARNPHPLTREDSFAPSAAPPLLECQSDSVSTIQSQTSQDSMAPPDSKKRRVARQLRRSSSSQQSVQHRRLLSEDYEDDDSSCAPKSVNLRELSSGQYLPPDTFVHVDCRLQKDKGKGELPGRDVCAEGKDACLEKLRQKMELLAQVALGNASPASGKKSKGSADMKRRKARISESAADYTETRSIIQLRMGFLAMQYGVLLRWDRKTHLINFVLLRKMCSESFYHKTLASQTCSPKLPLPTDDTSPLGFVIKNVVNGNCAILQHGGDVEMVMLDRPYLVPRPDTFAPSSLSVSVLNVDGLNPKSTWIVKVVVEGVSHSLRLVWKQEDASFAPRNSDTMKMDWKVPDSAIDLQMDLMVYEQKRSRQQRRRRLKTTLPVPMSFLDATTNAARSRFVVVPVDNDSSLTLSINFESDYARWLQQEVDARKKEDEFGFMSFFQDAPKPRVVENTVVSTPSTYLNPLGICCAW